MRLVRLLAVCAAVVLPAAVQAQNWEVGGGVGGGFYTSQDVTLGSAKASASIATNVAGSVWLDNSVGRHWGGEIRYDYQRGDLKLTQGSVKPTFAGDSHAIHYDFLWHATPPGSKIRPFVAAGAGIKVYRGTGVEQVFQPLSNFALLSQDHDLVADVSVGAGVKVQLSPRMNLRLEVHDYITPFPKRVITPNFGAKPGSWFNDFVPMVGLSYLF